MKILEKNKKKSLFFQRVQPAIPAPPPRIVDVTDEKNFWDRKPKPFSPGDGDWEKTLEHLFLQIYNFVKEEPELQELFGWKKFGRVRFSLRLQIRFCFIF